MSVSAITLRRALPSDAASIWEVRTRAIRSGCRSHYSPEDIEAWASAPMPPTFATLIAQEEFVVAELQSRVVGFAALKPQAKGIDAVFVCPDFAGQSWELVSYVVSKLSLMVSA